MIIRPMLACDADLGKLRFPLIAHPKIDGVRALHDGNRFVGRSLKPFACPDMAVELPLFTSGWDGELIRGEDPTASDLCRKTTSALTRKSSDPEAVWTWFVFDRQRLIKKPYYTRTRLEGEYVSARKTVGPVLITLPSGATLQICYVPHAEHIKTLEELIQYEESMLSLGFEGVILRDPDAPYKSGRATVRGGELLRLKRFIDAEAVVLGITEGQTNTNEQQTNLLGLSERSSHKAGMVGKGCVGSLECMVLDPVVYRGEVVLNAGDTIAVGPGNMTAGEREAYWASPAELIGQTIKFKFFPHGVKEKPRFPTFVSLRPDVDR